MVLKKTTLSWQYITILFWRKNGKFVTSHSYNLFYTFSHDHMCQGLRMELGMDIHVKFFFFFKIVCFYSKQTEQIHTELPTHKIVVFCDEIRFKNIYF